MCAQLCPNGAIELT
ncbi:MAG TPA: hypothetical protein GX507_03240 [Clostridia bacterium]|nr:hypothetical protein [Clostridia bacterium]